MVMSSDVFSKVAGMMAPSRGIIAEIVRRRSRALWLHFPALRDALSEQPLSFFIEPPPLQTLRPDNTLQQALAALAENGLDSLIVLDDQHRLTGILKAQEVANALLLSVSTPEESRRDATQVRVDELPTADPLTIASDDSSLLAASTMLDHGLSWLPVVVSKSDHRLTGTVRAERIGYWLLQELGKQTLVGGQAATVGADAKGRDVA
jgi:CBS domain-containing protein